MRINICWLVEHHSVTYRTNKPNQNKPNMIHNLYPQVLPSAYFVHVVSIWNMNIIFPSESRILRSLLELASEWIEHFSVVLPSLSWSMWSLSVAVYMGILYSSSSAIMQHSLISVFMSIFMIKGCWKKMTGWEGISLWLSVSWTVYH